MYWEAGVRKEKGAGYQFNSILWSRHQFHSIIRAGGAGGPESKHHRCSLKLGVWQQQGGLAVGSLDQGGYDFVRRFESVTHLLGGNGKVNYLWPVICDLGTRL